MAEALTTGPLPLRLLLDHRVFEQTGEAVPVHQLGELPRPETAVQDRTHQETVGNRLHQELIGPLGYGMQLVFRVIFGRQIDNGQAEPFGFKPYQPCQRDTGKTVQLHIQQHNIRLELRHDRHQQAGFGDQADIHPRRTQHQPVMLGQFGIILDNKDTAGNTLLALGKKPLNGIRQLQKIRRLRKKPLGPCGRCPVAILKSIRWRQTQQRQLAPANTLATTLRGQHLQLILTDQGQAWYSGGLGDQCGQPGRVGGHLDTLEAVRRQPLDQFLRAGRRRMTDQHPQLQPLATALRPGIPGPADSVGDGRRQLVGPLGQGTGRINKRCHRGHGFPLWRPAPARLFDTGLQGFLQTPGRLAKPRQAKGSCGACQPVQQLIGFRQLGHRQPLTLHFIRLA